MEQPNITVYGAPWCPDCRQSKQFLGEQRVRYNWVDIDQDEEGRRRVQELNDGKQIIPTIIFEDGSILVEPSNAELAAKLGISPKAERHYYDLVVVGSGPAGLTTALYAGREGIETLIIEKGGIGAIDYPLVADLSKEIGRDYDVLVEDGTVAYRGLFLIDAMGVVRHQLVNDLPLGRNIHEALRLVDALQFHEKNGEVCPANWNPGRKGMTPDAEGVASYLAEHASRL